MSDLLIEHLQPIEPRVELSMGPKMDWESVARFVSLYQRDNPNRQCIIDGTNRLVLSRPKGMKL